MGDKITVTCCTCGKPTPKFVCPHCGHMTGPCCSVEKTSSKLKAAIVIDTWKLSIFREHLTRAGYTYKELPGVTIDSLTLQVPYDPNEVTALEKVVRAANLAAEVSLHPGNNQVH